MSNGTQLERLWRLQTKINMLVSDGKRDAGEVADALQNILNAIRHPRWHEKDSIIYFSVTSNGMTGKAWIKRLEGNGFHIGNYAKQVLRSPSFKPTNGRTTEVAVLKDRLCGYNDRTTATIRAEAGKRNLYTPNAELACLIREKFRDDEIETMGLRSIVTMHESINDSHGNPYVLYLMGRYGVGCVLDAFCDRPDNIWGEDAAAGFAFTVSPQ